jgi:hypothetical protein
MRAWGGLSGRLVMLSDEVLQSSGEDRERTRDVESMEMN